MKHTYYPEYKVHEVLLSERNVPCPHENQEVQNYDPVWRDGDVVCTDCGVKIRNWDAG